MKKSAIPAILLALSTLTACGDKEAQTPPETAAVEQSTPESPTAPVLTPVAADSRSQVTPTHLDLYVADSRVANWEGIGTRNGDRLTSNATNGYLMFGPKVPFDAGNYEVTIHGEGLKIGPGNSITFDITSDEGKQVHAKQVLDDTTTVQPGAPLATFTFSLAEPVTDLEVRAYVTSGSEVTISRYEVNPVQSP
jgi:hypothetical protein